MTKRKTKQCPNCKSYISLSNFTLHYLSKNCLSGGKQTKNSSISCRYCNQIFTTPSGRGVHEIQCGYNPQRKIPNLGRTAWNKGIKTVLDNRNPIYIGKRGGYRENAGRSKKFKVFDSFGNQTTLQSLYEYAVFELLCELGLRWVRPKALKYNNKNYFADFYLVDFDVYLDPKNSFKAKQDEEKIRLVNEQNGNKVFVLLQNQINKNYIVSVI